MAPFRSKLTPFFEEIRQLRLRRRTWKQIAEQLEAEHGVKSAPSSVYEFFRRHRKRPAPLGFPEEEVSVQQSPVRPAKACKAPERPKFDWDSVKGTVFSENKTK